VATQIADVNWHFKDKQPTFWHISLISPGGTRVTILECASSNDRTLLNWRRAFLSRIMVQLAPLCGMRANFLSHFLCGKPATKKSSDCSLLNVIAFC
jgi:hypothetical protein